MESELKAEDGRIMLDHKLLVGELLVSRRGGSGTVTTGTRSFHVEDSNQESVKARDPSRCDA